MCGLQLHVSEHLLFTTDGRKHRNVVPRVIQGQNPHPHPNFVAIVYINGSLFAHVIYYTISDVEKTLQPFYVHISQ